MEKTMATDFSRFRFKADAETPPVYYDAYGPIDDGCGADVAVVLIHGWGGQVKAVLPAFMEALRRRAGSPGRTPYLLAPLFPRRVTMAKNGEPDDGRAVWGDSWSGEQRPPDQSCLASDDWRGGGDANGTSFSSFDYIDLIFARFADAVRFPNLKRVVLAGFSAGGQFVGRYAAVGKGVVREGVEVAYVAMSPSTEFRFEKDVPWLYGLQGRPRYSAGLTDEAIMHNLCTRRVWRACGSLDVDGPPLTALDISPPAVVQGTNRLARFRSFARYLEAFPEWKRQVSFHVFEGVAHQETLCYPDPALLDFVFWENIE